MFWKYSEEAKRLGQEDGLGAWKDRPLEVTSNDKQQSSQGAICNTTPFSRRKAKDQPVQEVSDLTPTPSASSPSQGNTRQHNTSDTRPGDNLPASTRQGVEGSSSKPGFKSFSSKYKRKG